jgi:hypothetical protein
MNAKATDLHSALSEAIAATADIDPRELDAAARLVTQWLNTLALAG